LDQAIVIQLVPHLSLHGRKNVGVFYFLRINRRVRLRWLFKNDLLEGIDKDLSIAAKHSKLKGLLNPISIAGGLDNPLVEVEYTGKQSNVMLTTQGESTSKIFG
jgi:hypothetical protein